MKRLSTIVRDLERAAADLEILAATVERAVDQDDLSRSALSEASNFRAAAGGISMVLGRLRS